jgi:hypothetical protein
MAAHIFPQSVGDVIATNAAVGMSRDFAFNSVRSLAARKNLEGVDAPWTLSYFELQIQSSVVAALLFCLVVRATARAQQSGPRAQFYDVSTGTIRAFATRAGTALYFVSLQTAQTVAGPFGPEPLDKVIRSSEHIANATRRL